MKEIKTAENYYILPGSELEDPIYIHKDKNAPAFFRGCFDYCYSSGLATIYKDSSFNWVILVLFTNEIADAFIDWTQRHFDIHPSSLTAAESEWEKLEDEYSDKGFRLVILRGHLDIYCILRYLKTCVKDEDEEHHWFSIFDQIELEFSKEFV